VPQNQSPAGQKGNSNMKAAKDQSDMGLEFNGQGKPVSYKGGMGYGGNKCGLTAKANYGMGPRTGNESDSPRFGGASVTRDPHKKTIATAAQGGKINGGAGCKSPANPDKIRY
jgi:hypothetical protein